MLDFPQFTKDTFPGVTRMDLFSGLFGDITDDAMFFPAGANGRPGGFDPMSPAWRKWLDKLANTCVKTGTDVQHISNNAPRPGRLRLAGGRRETQGRRRLAKRWLEGCTVLGVEVDAHELAAGARPEHPAQRRAARSRRRLPAQHRPDPAARRGHRVAQGDGRLRRQAGHQGDDREPLGPGRRPDEHPDDHRRGQPPVLRGVAGLRQLGARVHALQRAEGARALRHSNVHAKFWDRWGEWNDVQRSMRIMLAAGFRGTFALEYEQGPLDGVEGAKYLYKEVLAALTTPTPVVAG